MGYVVLLYHGGTATYAPDLRPGVRRVGTFLTRQEAREWLWKSGYGDGSINYEIVPSGRMPRAARAEATQPISQ